MMNKQQSRPMACLRYLALLPLLVLSVISCSQKKTAEPVDTTPHEIMCEGTVVDAETGDPLYGTAVLIKGTAKGTLADEDGNFRIPMMSDQTLFFSYVNYDTQEVSAAEKVSVKLKKSAPEALAGVTVSQESVEFTNGVAASSAEKVEETPQAEPIKGNENNEPIFTIVEDKASFPGKNPEIEMMSFLKDNLKYPASCADKGIQGVVNLKFIVQTDGSLTDFEAVSSPDEELTAAAIEACKKMPKWNPAKQRGKPVKSFFTIPITYRLQ